MRPHRRFLAERVPDHLLPWHVRQVLFGPDDMGDPHVYVVDHVGEQEQHRPIRPGDGKIVDRCVVEYHLAAHHVVDDRAARVGGAEPHHPARPWLEAEVAAVAVIAAVLIAGSCDYFLAGAGAVVGVALGNQIQHGRQVLVGVGRLEHRSLIAGFVHAKPGHRADDAVCPLRPVARCVGVLDAQHERAALLLGERPVEQRGPGGTDVEHAGRRRSEPDPDGRTRKRRGCHPDEVTGLRHRPACPTNLAADGAEITGAFPLSLPRGGGCTYRGLLACTGG